MHGPSGAGVILLISLLLGLRHASDPDHLAAVTTLIASEEERKQAHKAGLMGLLWGLGHGTTLVVLGLPLVLFNRFLPEPVQVIAETLIGAIIVFLAVRLLVRWRRGLYHAHTHSHDDEPPHRHVHSHRESGTHEHAHALPHRTPVSAYGIGLVHGIGGSGGLTLLLLSTISNRAEAAPVLGVLGVAFGAWYALGALALVTYPF
jgi:ABC-type nickel/cobalt efflux system permease component RcnA